MPYVRMRLYKTKLYKNKKHTVVMFRGWNDD